MSSQPEHNNTNPVYSAYEKQTLIKIIDFLAQLKAKSASQVEQLATVDHDEQLQAFGADMFHKFERQLRDLDKEVIPYDHHYVPWHNSVIFRSLTSITRSFRLSYATSPTTRANSVVPSVFCHLLQSYASASPKSYICSIPMRRASFPKRLARKSSLVLFLQSLHEGQGRVRNLSISITST
jgi:hypothetical protein